MLKSLLTATFSVVFLFGVIISESDASSVTECERTGLENSVPMSKADQIALCLGRKVLAVRKALSEYKRSNAMNDIVELGLDQRSYAMVRGWLSYKLQADISLYNSVNESSKNEIKERIIFIKKSIRAIDLE